MVGDEPERVYSEVRWHPETGSEWSSASTIRFRNGVVASFLCSQGIGGGYDYIEVMGDAGRIRADWPSDIVQVYSEALEQYRHPTTLQPRRSLVAEMYQDEMRAWTASLAEKRAPPISVDDGVRVLEIIDAIFESGKTERPVELKR
jgi:predicted dehydrogenase